MLNNVSFRGLHLVLTLFTAVIVLVACGPKTSIVTPPVDASDQTDDVELSGFLAGLYAEAVRNADSGLHRGRLAMAYDANGFVAASIQSYEQASLLDETDMRWPYLQALSVAEAGRVDEALSHLDNAIRRNPSYLPSLLAKGYWLLDTGNFELACDTFDHATDQTADSSYLIPIQLGLAQCQLELGEIERASQTVESIRESDLSVYGSLVRARVRRAAGLGNTEDENAIPADAPGQQTWPDSCRW